MTSQLVGGGTTLGFLLIQEEEGHQPQREVTAVRRYRPLLYPLPAARLLQNLEGLFDDIAAFVKPPHRRPVQLQVAAGIELAPPPVHHHRNMAPEIPQR